MKSMWWMFLVAAVWMTSMQACSGHQAPSSAAKAQPAKAQALKPGEEAQPITKDGITVLKTGACTSIENRQPVGETATFLPDVGRIYVYSNIHLNAPGDTSILHIWNFNGKKMATVTLPIKGASWRTFSSKKIDPSWLGEWRVDLATPKGEILKSVTFRVEKKK